MSYFATKSPINGTQKYLIQTKRLLVGCQSSLPRLSIIDPHRLHFHRDCLMGISWWSRCQPQRMSQSTAVQNPLTSPVRILLSVHKHSCSLFSYPHTSDTHPSVNFKVPFLSVITTEWVELLFHTQKILGTDFRTAILFSSVSPRRFRVCISNGATTFNTISNSLSLIA